MWLSGQQKRPVDPGEGQTGIVTMSGGEMAVLMDSERRGLHVYSPAGYHWTPKVGQRVLVIQGRGETPCVAGARQDGGEPDQVSIGAKRLSLGGGEVDVAARGRAALQAPRLDWNGQVYVRGELLEDMMRRIAMAVMGGGAG